MAVFFIPLMLWDFFVLKVHRNPSTGLDWDNPRPRSPDRISKRWLGLVWVMLGVALYYWAVPEYRDFFYNEYFSILPLLGFGLALVAAPYFWWLDAYYKEKDGYIELADLLLGKFRGRDWNLLKELALGWLVKAFFLPLMYCYTVNSFEALSGRLNTYNGGVSNGFGILFDLSFLVDLMVVSVGYMYTLRLADTHIRSSEPTFYGWAIAVVCYKPFWGFFYDHFVRYENGNGWEGWFGNSPTMMIIWGTLILVMHVIYAWSSVLFGLRFSNLTYRGLISAGSYSWCRHPAYLSKNISWWLISAPFMAGAPTAETIRQCLGLVLNNLIYYLRAKTEEAHLRRYPEYDEYYRWMEKHGVVTVFLKRIFRRK